MDISKKLKSRRIALKLTMLQVAQKVGVSEATISRWESGDIANMRRDKIVSLANALEVSPSFIMDCDEFGNSPATTATQIPVLGRVAAGIPIDAVEEIIDYEEVTPEVAKSGKLIGLKIKGQSMEPRICDGDVVIVKCQDYIENNHIGIFLINGDEATCKKVKFTEQGMTLISLNPIYEPMFFTPKEIENLPVKIFGVVIELRGKF